MDDRRLDTAFMLLALGTMILLLVKIAILLHDIRDKLP